MSEEPGFSTGSDDGSLRPPGTPTHRRLESLIASLNAVRSSMGERLLRGRTRVRSALAPVVDPPLRLLRWIGRGVGRLADLVWRVPFVAAAMAMLLAAAVHAGGRQDLAWTLVTGGFAVGLLGVPLGLLSVGLGASTPEPDAPAALSSGADHPPTKNPPSPPLQKATS